MKTEDFERLKKLCDENGFELVTESPDQNDKFFVVKLKPQPIKVIVSDFSHFGTSVQFKMLLSRWSDKKGTDIGDYLAKCLEDYLNQDAK